MFLLLGAILILCSAEQPLVETKLGKIQGFQINTQVGGTADIFLGIPFAQPPVGELRFEKPLPAKPWTEALNATKWGFECVPHTLRAKIFEIDEDCLTVNVIRPSKKAPTDGFPVLMWIHGGGYEIGSARLYGYQGFADAFAHRDVIVVTLQYRIGIFGFLSTGDSELPGNLGLWDLALGLKWVHENIESFGGDPRRITPWGLSAGGGAVGQLILSPHSRDYAASAVEMSGSAFASWAIGVGVINNSFALIKELGCESNTKSCLKSKTIKEIDNAVESIGYTTSDMNIIKWGPRIDGDFIPVPPEQLAKEAPPKPTIIGVSNKDAGFFTIMGKSRYIQSFLAADDLYSFKEKEMIKRIDELARSSIPYKNEEGYQNILEHYLKGYENADKAFYLNKYTEFITDTMFNVAAVNGAESRIKAGWPVYLYSFDHYNDAIWEPIKAPIGVRGSVHINEFTYMLDMKILAQWDYNQADIIVKENLRDALANFTKTGVPVWNGVNWPKASSELEYIVMQEHPLLKKNFFKDATTFWSSQKKKYDFDGITMMSVKKGHEEL